MEVRTGGLGSPCCSRPSCGLSVPCRVQGLGFTRSRSITSPYTGCPSGLSRIMAAKLKTASWNFSPAGGGTQNRTLSTPRSAAGNLTVSSTNLGGLSGPQNLPREEAGFKTMQNRKKLILKNQAFAEAEGREFGRAETAPHLAPSSPVEEEVKENDPLKGDDPLLREARSLRIARSRISLADAFRSGGKPVVRGAHDPDALNCMCCAPKTLVEEAEEEARRMQLEGSRAPSAKLQLLMALCALVAIGIKWRSVHSKL